MVLIEENKMHCNCVSCRIQEHAHVYIEYTIYMSMIIEMRGGSWQWGVHCKGEGQLRSPMAPQCVICRCSNTLHAHRTPHWIASLLHIGH